MSDIDTKIICKSIDINYCLNKFDNVWATYNLWTVLGLVYQWSGIVAVCSVLWLVRGNASIIISGKKRVGGRYFSADINIFKNQSSLLLTTYCLFVFCQSWWGQQEKNWEENLPSCLLMAHHCKSLCFCSLFFNKAINILFSLAVYFIGLFRLIAYLAAPVSLVKSGISLLHLITASMDMGAMDMAEREKAATEAKKEWT